MFRKYILIMLLPLLSILSYCAAAGPITHASLTKKFWEYFPQYDNKQKSEFMIGTLFPDIRYIAQLERSVTHVENVQIEDVLSAPTAFQAGLLFHSYVDQQREIFVQNSGLYDYVATFNPPKACTQIKLAEDEILFSSADWKSCRACLKKFLNEEKEFVAKESDLQQWHVLLDYCFTYCPSTILWYLSAREIAVMDVLPSEMEATYELHKTLAQDTVIKEHTVKLLGHFENLFKEAAAPKNQPE